MRLERGELLVSAQWDETRDQERFGVSGAAAAQRRGPKARDARRQEPSQQRMIS
jgi:hypothetical protein